MSRLSLTPLVFLSRLFLPGRRCSDVKAAATYTPSAFHNTKHSLLHRQHLCGISGWDTPDTTSLLKFYNLFLFQCNKSDAHSCSSCRLGKHVRLPFADSASQTFFPFQLVHSDVWTSPVLSHSGYKYYVVFLDDYSHYLWTIPLRNKSDVLPTVRSFISYVHTQ